MTLQAINRSSTARRRFGALLWLALGLKVLLPPGFMLAQVDGHPQLVMCPAGIQARAVATNSTPAMADMPPMAGMDHGAHVGHGAHADHAAQGCPFALASGVAFVAQHATQPDPWFLLLKPAIALAGTTAAPEPPLRHRAPRGPPIPA